MGPLTSLRSSSSEAGQAGELLDIVALDRNGVLVTSEGALVRVLEVTPRNPRVMGTDQQQMVSDGFAAMCGRLRVGQSLQFVVEATPIPLHDVLAAHQATVDDSLKHRQPTDPDALQALAHAHAQTLREHAGEQAAVRFRAYAVVPYLPPLQAKRVDWTQLRPRRPRKNALARAPLTRALEEHRQIVRDSLVHTETITSDLEALDLSTLLLDGPQVAELLYRRFNPSTVAGGHVPRLQVTGELDAIADAQAAVAAAEDLRERVARSPIDLDDSRFLGIDGALERVHYVSSIPDFTEFGWLLSAMEIDAPFALAVHVHALDRRAERRKARGRRKRMHAFITRAEVDGRVPDDDMIAQRDETRALLGELRGRERAHVHAVSIYQSVREPGPIPDQARLVQASERAVDAIRDASDADAKHGGWMQRDLWLSTLPLGRDVARRTRRYVSRNVGDTVPLVGPSCGSPTGLPTFFARGVRTLESLNPWDPQFLNHLMVVNGLQGSGKTVFGIVTAARLVAHGVNVTVLDRSGHWEMLTQLVPGGAHLSIGAGSGDATINPWDVPDPRRVPPEKIAFLRDLHELLVGDHHAGTDHYEITERERSLLSEAIRGVYQRCAREGGRMPLERDLHTELTERQDNERQAAHGAETDRSATLASLADRLTRYIHDGEDAWLADRPTTVVDAPIVVYDTRAARGQLAPAMFIAMERTVADVDRRRQDRAGNHSDQQPLFPGDALLSDETWALMQRRATGEYFNNLARRSRHLNLFLLAITQHLSDFDNEYGRPLLRSATMQLFFQQAQEELRFVQETLGLSDSEVTRISRLQTSGGKYAAAYWINGPRGRGEVTLRLGGLEYWLSTSEPGRDVPRRNAALAQHPG
ncbi:MAG: VirB4 family type IV secretion system protein, partial [Solirubrobacteraceae bacterium]